MSARGYDIISGQQRPTGREATVHHQPQNQHKHAQHRPNPVERASGHQQQQQQDEQIAQMLQAQEYHRAMHPSRVGGDGGGHQAAASGAPVRDAHGARQARQCVRDQQLAMAMEVNPEAFVSVPMLYVQCELNNVPVRAFIDTGAQMTVMNVKCAQKTGLLPAVDSRFKGVAAGVGMARIAGRVHMATLRLNRKIAVDTSITVLEQSGGIYIHVNIDQAQ
jgi:hypothetical protein